MTLVLSNADIQKALTMPDSIETLAVSFKDQAAGRTVDRPRSHTDTALEGENLGNRYYQFKSMDGSVQRFRIQALRLNSNIIVQEEVGGNRRWEIDSTGPGKTMCGLVLLFSMDTGELLAIMQDRFIQEIRVGATSALAAKAMARGDSSVVGLFGTGGQAGPQLTGLHACFRLKQVKVFSPNPDHRRRFVRRMAGQLGVDVIEARDARHVVEGSDIIACATNSFSPVFSGDWLQPGQHVNSVTAWELDRTTFARSKRVIVRSMLQSVYAFMGDEQSWQEPIRQDIEEIVKPKLCTLGQALLGQVKRESDADITLHGGSGSGGSSGLGGTQFAAVSHAAFENARRMGLGQEIPTEWFQQKQARDAWYGDAEANESGSATKP